MSEDYFSFTKQLFKRAGIEAKPEALAGIRVLDLTHVIFGPTVSKWLAMYGAEVIKVEEPEEGDIQRTASYWAKFWKDSNPLYQSINPNKYFVAIDLRVPKGKELVLELAKKSDVVVENFRAGMVEAWGVGYTTVSQANPRVVYLSCSGYGQWGPLRFFPSYDLIAQSMSGSAMLTGFPGRETYKLQDYFGDFFPALLGAIGVLAALNYREQTGKGQYIDMPQVEALARVMPNWTYMSVTGKDLERTGNVDPTMAPSGIFKVAGGKFVAIAIATEDQLLGLLKAMGRLELAEERRFTDTFQRLQAGNAEELSLIVERWAGGKTEEEIMALACEYGFPAAPVMDDWRIVNDEWRRERGSVVEFEDEMYGRGVWPGAPVAMEKTPGRLKSLARPIGYHNHHVFKNVLGLSTKEINRLEKEHVIGYWDNRVGLRPPPYYDINKDPVFRGEE